jgi:hypothetical protein
MKVDRVVPMRRYGILAQNASPAGQTLEEIYLRVEMANPKVESLERRARMHTRELGRLLNTYKQFREFSVSDGTSQMSNELMDLVVDTENKEWPSEPLKPLQTAVHRPLHVIDGEINGEQIADPLRQ